MQIKRTSWVLGTLLVVIGLLAGSVYTGQYFAQASQQQSFEVTDSGLAVSDGEAGPVASHRLIVQLASPSLSEYYAAESSAAKPTNGKIDFQAPDVQTYLNKLQAEQSAFINQMSAALPGASVSQYINELGAKIDLTYQVSFNGMTIDPGSVRKDEAARILSSMPGVKGVFNDYAHQPDLYASVPLINAQAAWNNAAIGGMENAGAGIKFASMDGGAHKDAPMFDGTGYSYPPGYPSNGLGLTANNNGKIILSRAYFRTWDPPSAGDENPWPGTQGTSHGTHTTSTAVGNEVVASYLGITQTLSGVAPKAWIMSYRVFYNSVTNDGSFYNAEGIAALEDIMMDGADVLNNSWGGGPGSVGGEFDPLDMALINVANAGTFVSMSAGNAGPGNGTTDHSSNEYINVAASQSGGTFAAGRLSVAAPEPVPVNLTNMSYGSAQFGDPLPIGTIITHTFMTAASVDPGNTNGCAPWTGTPFTGNAVLIARGSCNFSIKVYYAQQAGAEFVVIYNNAGNSLTNMAAGTFASSVTIPSIFIGQTNGTNMLTWYGTNGAASVLALNTQAFQSGNTPDVIASFSSRGPGVGNVLKPEITAPGVNILAQGYADGVTGEARHLGWGQASGTSMASPHVAGAAVLIRQIHPDWSNAYIKSALMSTSKFEGIWNGNGSHAQPLDMGAGRLDLTNAADPGVILDPPSVSGGLIMTGSVETMHVMVTSVADAAETYDLSAVSVTGTYPTPTVGTLPGFSVSPASISLDPGETVMITVTFDSSLGSIGDNQGHIVFDGSVHDPHMPAWVRVSPAPSAEVLVIDNDFSYLLGFNDYLDYYTDALDALGITYDVYDADEHFANPTTIPEAAVLSSYKAVIYFTGDNYYNNGAFAVATPLTALDMNRLTEYANSGGTIIAMGQDLASVLNSTASSSASFFYASVLGGEYLQDSVTSADLPVLPITADVNGPAELQGISLDLSGPSVAQVMLVGASEVPPVATTNSAIASFAYNAVTGQLDYEVEVTANTPITVTASHIHKGAAGVNGPVLYPLFNTPTYVTDSLTFAGSLTINPANEAELLSGNTYINVHTSGYLAGELRTQVEVAVNSDGAANQYYIDELASAPNSDPNPGKDQYPYMPLLSYAGPYNLEQGTVAMGHRDQPNLEVPGIDYLGKSVYTTFGLEGVNDGMSRAGLLAAFLDWAMDEPLASIADTTTANASNMTMFEASLNSDVGGTGVSYRWDFGDGSSYTPAFESADVSHVYTYCGVYTVRVEATDSWGNKAIGTYQATVDNCTYYRVFMPILFANAP